MNERPIGLRTLVAGQIGWWRIEAVLEPDVVVQLRRRPGQAGAARSVEVLADVPWANPKLRATARCDMPTL